MPALTEPAGEGEVCTGPTTCREGLACVADVGADYGHPAAEDVCERPRVVYDFLHFGERGEDRRIDEALDMLGGTYLLPRMSESEGSLEVAVHDELVLAGGQPADCSAPAALGRRECLVPVWSRYLGDAIPKYSRFILYGLRMTAPFVYVYQHASDARLNSRVEERTGHTLSKRELGELRRAARDAAIAVFDSFISQAHQPLALAELPRCSPRGGGYQNPNVTWAPELDAWDPTTRLERGRLVTSAEVPVDCTDPEGMTFLDLRDSLWDRHATAYRALSAAGALQLFRGLLSEQRRRAWLAALRDTADALALPSSYEAGNNHGVTQSTALIQLGHELSAAARLVPPALSAAWVDLGRHRLNDFVVDTVFSDGVQVEQSPFYHNYQLGLMLHVVRWLRQTGFAVDAGIDPRYGATPEEIPPEQRRDFDSREAAPMDRDINHLNPQSDLEPERVVDAMARAASHLVQPDGWIPMIGSSLPQQFRGYSKAAFEPFLRRDSRAARELWYVWSGGESGEAPPESDRLMVFPDSGFVTLRSAFSTPLERQTHVVFNAGMPHHRHSHADALAVHLYGPRGRAGAGGAALLVDSGWYSYRDDGRHYFESTSAHNTVGVDGLNQCTRTPIGKRAAPDVDAPLDACSDRAARAEPEVGRAAAIVKPGTVSLGLSARGATDGVNWLYQSAAHGLYERVAHRRAVVLIGADVLLVLDRLTSDEPREFEQRWHITPDAAPLSASIEQSSRTFHIPFMSSLGAGDETLFSLHQSSGSMPAITRVYQGEAARDGVPGMGWISTAEGQMTSHPVIAFLRSAATDAAFGSVFLLGELAAERAEVTLEELGAHGIRAVVELPRGRVAIDVANLARGSGERVELSPEWDLRGDPG